MDSSDKPSRGIFDERVKRALQSLGLTDYEARAYLSLIQSGPLTASALSNIADIPYSKIYEVLGSLEEKGWIEVEDGRPSKYHAKSPATAIELTKLRLEGEIKENCDVVISELMPIYEGREGKERPNIWILRGEQNILSKLKELIAKCEHELLLATPILTKELARSLIPLLFSIKERNGTVRVMISSEVDQQTLKKLAELVDVRIRDQMFGGGTVSDSREVMIILTSEDERKSAIAIWSEHAGLARFAKNYFEYLWNDAISVKK